MYIEDEDEAQLRYEEEMLYREMDPEDPFYMGYDTVEEYEYDENGNKKKKKQDDDNY